MNTDDRALADLKPCRLCGGEAERYTVMSQPEYANRQVRCRSCTASAFDDDWQRPALADGYKLPCDVHLPPATVVAAGCDLATLKLAMEFEGRPRKFDGNPRNALPADRLEAFHAKPVVGERDREYWARVLHDAWPHTVISEALSQVTGVPIGTVLTWDAVKQAGADCSGLYRYADAIVAALQSPPPVVSGKALVTAARDLLAGMSSTYKARNGREMGIEADDGEKCWIVHSDLIAALEGALETVPTPPVVEEGRREALARIIDPEAFRSVDEQLQELLSVHPRGDEVIVAARALCEDNWTEAEPARNRALAKADAILALTPVEGVGVTQAQRDEYARRVEGDSDNPLRVDMANKISAGMYDVEVAATLKDSSHEG